MLSEKKQMEYFLRNSPQPIIILVGSLGKYSKMLKLEWTEHGPAEIWSCVFNLLPSPWAM